MNNRDGWAAWAISQLKLLPDGQFYKAVQLMVMGYSSSFVARWLLRQPERGCLQDVTFHTLRTYLTPINKQIGPWRRTLDLDRVPEVLKDYLRWVQENQAGPRPRQPLRSERTIEFHFEPSCAVSDLTL